MRYPLIIHSITLRIHSIQTAQLDHPRPWYHRVHDAELLIHYYNLLAISVHLYWNSIHSPWLAYSGYHFLNHRFQLSNVLVVDFLLISLFVVVMNCLIIFSDPCTDPWWLLNDELLIHMVGSYVSKFGHEHVSLMDMVTMITVEGEQSTLTLAEWMSQGAQRYCDLKRTLASLDTKMVRATKTMACISPEYYDLEKLVTFAKLYRVPVLPRLSWKTKFYTMTAYLNVEAYFGLYLVFLGEFLKAVFLVQNLTFLSFFHRFNSSLVLHSGHHL